MIHSVTQNILISDDTRIYWSVMIHVLQRIYWSVMIHSVTQDILISDDTQCNTGYTDQGWDMVLHRIIYWSVMIHSVTQEKILIGNELWYTVLHRIFWSVMIHSVTMPIYLLCQCTQSHLYHPGRPLLSLSLLGVQDIFF